MPYKDEEKRKTYTKSYGAKWYQRNKNKVMEKSKRREEEIIKWYKEYKSTLSCMICGEKHPACLQFHHRDKAEKSFSVANMAKRPTSKKRLIDEIAKCDVLCVNCHAKLHWREKHETDSWEELLDSE